jgi:hypothetical protein
MMMMMPLKNVIVILRYITRLYWFGKGREREWRKEEEKC